MTLGASGKFRQVGAGETEFERHLEQGADPSVSVVGQSGDAQRPAGCRDLGGGHKNLFEAIAVRAMRHACTPFPVALGQDHRCNPSRPKSRDYAPQSGPTAWHFGACDPALQSAVDAVIAQCPFGLTRLPDDPTFPLLGSPRVMSSADCDGHVLRALNTPANGVTLCTGSLGVDPRFDTPEFVRRFGPHLHFAHLRNTKRLPSPDMMRPDHGQEMLSDRDRESLPRYPLLGRMRGLAELRGIMAAVGART